MRNPDVYSYKQRLDVLFALVQELPEDPPEVRSHWARYLCVITSGFLETSVRALYLEYARRKAHANVANFVDSELSGFQNPKMDKILDLARRFSPEWEADLRAETDGERKDAVDSIVSNRHNIAHGRNVGITYASIRQYYERALDVVDLIEKQCDV